MIRNAASKVMWVGRATVFLLGVAVILALLFGVASSAFAHGDNKGFFHLGHKNVTSKVSTLIKRGRTGLELAGGLRASLEGQLGYEGARAQHRQARRQGLR